MQIGCNDCFFTVALFLTLELIAVSILDSSKLAGYVMCLSAMVFKSYDFQRFASKLCADVDISNAPLTATVGGDGIIV